MGLSMANDITKCSGEKGSFICPLRDNCFRYLSKPNDGIQSWMEAPYENDIGGCESFWNNARRLEK